MPINPLGHIVSLINSMVIEVENVALDVAVVIEVENVALDVALVENQTWRHDLKVCSISMSPR